MMLKMLSKKTIELCIAKLDDSYKEVFRAVTNDEGWMKYRSNIMYEYEHALTELKNELQIIEEENLNE